MMFHKSIQGKKEKQLLKVEFTDNPPNWPKCCIVVHNELKKGMEQGQNQEFCFFWGAGGKFFLGKNSIYFIITKILVKKLWS